ncbi:NmrA family NAD(P)-binding protein [Methylobacterium fujisawaense]
MRRALARVHGVLSVQTPMGPDGAEGEERQGKALASLLAEAGVRHLVYCSAGGAERDSGVPHFESKRAIERHTSGLGMPSTVLRPAAFMENFGSFAFRTVMLSMMRTYLRPDQAMQLVSVRDVGWFAAEAFERPDAYVGREIELGGDAVTYGEAAATLRRGGKGPTVALTLPGILLRRMPGGFRSMFAWIARAGFRADVPGLRRAHPGLLTLRDWAASAGTAPPLGSRP